MMRCKPLLGTYVEILIDDAGYSDQSQANGAMNDAFEAIELIHQLMGFHNPMSELSKINQCAHLRAVSVHDWTYAVLSIALDVYQQSGGLFDCGVGQHLTATGLLPGHTLNQTITYGGLEDLVLDSPNLVSSAKPMRLDLGGIAKGFAVDKAVEILLHHGMSSGSVNAGGDLRVFGSTPKQIQVRSPRNPSQLIYLGSLENGAIASTSLYYANSSFSHIINPITMEEVRYQDSFSILAPKCIYADALTKVLAVSQDEYHPCFDQFSAKAIRISA